VPRSGYLIRRALVALAFAFALAEVRPSYGQLTSLADDIVLISKGVQTEEQARTDTRLGEVIGGAERPFGATPGSGESRMGGLTPPRGPMASRPALRRDVLSAISSEGQRPQGAERLPSLARREAPAMNAPLYGALEVPETEQEGPPNGWTLDMAIEQLVRENIELRTKGFEIPKARADVLTASLRANPMVFGSISSVPYGSYSPTRQGEINYSATVIYPVDVSHKRLARTDVAARAQQVLEAQYQDAVRIEIDNLYTLYVDLVAARDTLRYAEASQSGMESMSKIMEGQNENKLISRADLDKILIQRDLAELGLEQSRLALRQAQQNLAVILHLPLDDPQQIELRATLRDKAPQPSRDEMRTMALANRPDLMAYRLGIARAQSDVRLAQAERYSDVFLLYSPWELRNNTPTGSQNATSWSVAAFGSVPLFNKNQGNIRRAQINVNQTQTELEALERHVIAEVDRVYAEYVASRDAVDRIEHGILPRSRHVRDITAHLVRAGQASAVDYLGAQRDYNEVVRQYRDALIRHRRSMLKLNTAVARRIVP
jgi:cobalt-zinc-cadmium efflux system outer membrane protein